MVPRNLIISPGGCPWEALENNFGAKCDSRLCLGSPKLRSDRWADGWACAVGRNNRRDGQAGGRGGRGEEANRLREDGYDVIYINIYR